ncbi:MAG: hypothetical protein LPH21_12070 [Shewanella sp.]|nr:hypothetical protein [Shewanella sp.]
MKTSVRIKSKSHKLSSESFRLLEKLKTNFMVEVINERAFHLIWNVSENSDLFNKYHDHHCSIAFSSMLAAINIASLGLFSWHDGTDMGPIYARVSSEENKPKFITLQADHKQEYENIRELTEKETHDALILFGSMAREKEQIVVVEYIKGVMHLSSSYYDINFHREAFANFYRVIEYVVTNRIICKRKLSNELLEIQDVFKGYGVDEKLSAEFKEVYIKRGSQIMHAQLEPESVSFDDAVIAKTFCDFLLNKYYRNIAEEWRKSTNEA